MTAEKKDRKPLQIKNLADLKRHIRLGTELVATAHQYHPDIVGLTRVVTKVQTNGFYSKIKDQPDHKWSTCNHGAGFWSPYNKAGAYRFTGTAIQVALEPAGFRNYGRCRPALHSDPGGAAFDAPRSRHALLWISDDPHG